MLGRDISYFVNKIIINHSDSTKMFSDNIFDMLGGRVFQQKVGIPMDTNYGPLLANLFLYSYEAYFIQVLLNKHDKMLSGSLNFTFRYLDDLFH